ncbi:MAG: HesA/MoeB/ThiF family protein [Syntrophobacteraceae bacterium]|nr:HesA/MoeB/ThiF family protein [Syntrophobacteraceae bacterium]
MGEKRRFLMEFERRIYHRHLLLPEFGEEGQLRLLNSRVLVVGLGGLGSPALFYLAACGVGELGMVDADTVEYSNLQRQILHGYRDVGRNKTSSAHETISRLREDVRLNAHPVRLSRENARAIISQYDFVIEATDNFESKFLVNDVCVALGKAFSHAGILGMVGQAMTVVPGEGPCFRCLFDDLPPPGAVKTTDEIGVLGVVPGILGAIQATEAIKCLARCGDLLVGRLLTFDAFTMTFREISLPTDKRCPACAVSRKI